MLLLPGPPDVKDNTDSFFGAMEFWSETGVGSDMITNDIFGFHKFTYDG